MTFSVGAAAACLAGRERPAVRAFAGLGGADLTCPGSLTACTTDMQSRLGDQRCRGHVSAACCRMYTRLTGKVCGFWNLLFPQ